MGDTRTAGNLIIKIEWIVLGMEQVKKQVGDIF
jgi:hypothetical protein